MGKGSCFSFFCPCGATLTYKQIPKALPWADLLLAFQAVFTPTVNTPLPWGADTHPLPLPKGGGQGTSTYTSNRLTSNGRYSPLPWGGVGGGASAQADSISAGTLGSLRPEGAVICQPRATPCGKGCSRDNALKGQKNKNPHKRLSEGEAAFHSFAPAGRH